MQSGELILALSIAALAAATASLTITLLEVRPLSLRVRRLEALAGALTSRAVRSFIKSSEARRKVRKRYLIIRVVGAIDRHGLEKLIADALKLLYGSTALSIYGVRVVDFDSKSMTAIVRLRSDGRWAVLAALGAVESVSGESVALVPIRLCGTLRKAREYVRKLRC